jgi:hypothetical protein
LADRSTQLLLDALSRAAADPAGLPLYASKSGPGLFPATAAARHAAQRCMEEALVKVIRTEARGKALQEVCALTDKGLAYLLSQVSPRQLLEDLVRAIEARQVQLADLVSAARQAQTSLEAFRALAGKVLQQLNSQGGAPLARGDARPSANGADGWTASALAYLVRRQDAGAAQDCPLPELYEAARPAHPKLTLGEFHDGLRRLHEQGRIYLHLWTGPLHDLPEPACALLVGHEVAYYASLR